jgi:uncharacterized protein (TIGR02594 family)
MVQLVAFCRSLGRVSPHLVALALCSAAIVGSVSPASAKSHRPWRHGHAHDAVHRIRRHYAYRHHRHYRRIARGSRRDAGLAQTQAHGIADTNTSFSSSATSGAMAASSGFGSSNIVAEARRFIGTGNPTSRATLWCARFMNMVLRDLGYRGTGSDAASSFASYGQRVSGPQVGAIAVMSRHGGGHVGVVSGIDAQGNPILVSGNYGNRVREAAVSRRRIYAYVVPAG